jgi:hypothetical protein
MAVISDGVGSFGWGERRNARRRHCRSARGELGICRYGRSSVHILLVPAHEESKVEKTRGTHLSLYRWTRGGCCGKAAGMG